MINVEEQYVPYTFLPFLAEAGGFLGIFLGYSAFDLIKLLVKLIQKVPRKPKKGKMVSLLKKLLNII